MIDTSTVKRQIRELGITTEDEDYDYFHALIGDEAFAAACHRLSDAEIYADHEHATDADRQAHAALRRSVREHAQRVRARVDATNGGAEVSSA